MSQMNLLKQELFGDPDSAISDIKFYPGDNGFKLSPEEIAGQARGALHAISNGNCRDIDLSV